MTISLQSQEGATSAAGTPASGHTVEFRHDGEAPLGPEQTGDSLDGGAVPSAADFLDRITKSHLRSAEELDAFLANNPGCLEVATTEMVHACVTQGFLTDYQVSRLLAGQTCGLVLGNYRIVDRIGTGGMGIVYKAEHIHMKRPVAVKVLIAQEDVNSVFLQRFYSEMQAVAVLNHPNIVLAFDAGEIRLPKNPPEILHYLVMEYVPGKNLEEYVAAHGPMPVAKACQYVLQVASGLQHAHEHGLVHRDIKPSNLLLTSQEQIKVLDFGLARLGRRRHTEAHTMLGSVDYMAPEQARDARSVDIRADIYGLGGTLYWLLTGKKPFAGDRSLIEEVLARQRESPRPLHESRPDIPLELEAIVFQMMALEPHDRYPTPLAVMGAIHSFLETMLDPGPAATAADRTPLTVNQRLEQTLRLRDADLCQTQDVLIFAMAKMAELRGETGGHLLRMQSYVRLLAEEIMRLPSFAGRVDEAFAGVLERCVLLHDIGKVAIPDHILLKPGKLDAEERSIMESHTVLGADILRAVARQHGASLGFLQVAGDIARHHHERFDGQGYPDSLAGEAIPLSARIVTVADVYDALRCKLVYKPALAHGPAKRLILEASPGQFDPAVLVAFRNCEANFEHIFSQTRD
jgi:HD-GYP domain-containing protein (c-di-GMP phosphodiesterase class II)